MTPVELSRSVLCAVRRAVDEGELAVAVPERAVVTAPGPGGCGDYATNIALQLARPAGQPALRIAEILRPHLAGADGVADVVVTGPGFLNIRLGGTASVALVEEILRRGARYGYANGPSADFVALSCPREVRAVVVMDVVARILSSQGAAVRTHCEAELPQEWADILGVRVDTVGGGSSSAGRPSGPGRPVGSSGSRPDESNGDGRQGNDAGLGLGPGSRATRHQPLPPHLPHYAVRPVPAPLDPLFLGRDAARWALLHPAEHDRPRVTDEHLVQRESNPLFRVRYAYARTRALTRNAADLGFSAEPGPVEPSTGHSTDHRTRQSADQRTPQPADHRTRQSADQRTPQPADHRTRQSADQRTPQPADHRTPQSADQRTPQPADHPTRHSMDQADPTPADPFTPHPLQTALADHPRVLAQAAAHRAPDRLARHLVAVADAVLPLLAVVLPRGAEKPSAAHRARLALAEAAGAVLAGGLSLLGIDAPEHL
ncbi:ArgS-related anticodon-binding protein NrtL [Streptomyces sp. KS_5]|uniref:ArgS-related anticodon-binding protein NrtL n=1 Tax=Streptomyces sp. KS_5 TaxID=1881018 RepID=UPI000894978A|nr:DALR anticodon-binding domain-containing protein [Streptomyces sp. KS_5]SEC34627.1 arginyl-tRNA synthetase [Streptomyces sp. KS_5]